MISNNTLNKFLSLCFFSIEIELFFIIQTTIYSNYNHNQIIIIINVVLEKKIHKEKKRRKEKRKEFPPFELRGPMLLMVHVCCPRSNNMSEHPFFLISFDKRKFRNISIIKKPKKPK